MPDAHEHHEDEMVLADDREQREQSPIEQSRCLDVCLELTADLQGAAGGQGAVVDCERRCGVHGSIDHAADLTDMHVHNRVGNYNGSIDHAADQDHGHDASDDAYCSVCRHVTDFFLTYGLM